eukprot:SAG31_NODE_12860_length_911_cov_0.991379_1_plen_173_part_01
MPPGEPGNAVQQTAPAALDELQNWAFDTLGYIVLSGAADASELLDPSALATHPTLLTFVEDLCGVGYFADLPLQSVDRRFASGLVGGDSCLDNSREYFHKPEGYFTFQGNQDYKSGPTEARIRQCQGLVAVWALEDTAVGEGFGVVPCSHQSELPPPPGINISYYLILSHTIS